MGKKEQIIFMVEDDDNIREMVMYALSSVGFNTEGFDDYGGLKNAMIKTTPSLILLDIMLPKEDGVWILKKLKESEKTKALPIIMLTAKGAELDRIKGLDLGADDYITKPFSVLEVISRIKAVLRRSQTRDRSNELTIGSLVLCSDSRSVFLEDKEIVLTYKEFELLSCLMRNVGIVLTRDTLLEQAWGFDFIGTSQSRTVDMHVKSLRQKLGGAGDMIKTVRNVGYKIREKP
ncbi:MAG: response regulator transcription factor [Helicobacteraceae bacterium]|jgi:two-component system alkaline phosphatase synthesis response regulator PhoP|nr:response regulator transcription factor [Helicobacteraceae bacterium]